MPKTIVILFAAIAIYILFFGSTACWLLPLGKFQSLEVKSEIQVLPMSDTDPVEYLRYHPALFFRYGQFNLQESDYFFSGPYVCRFGRIVASHSNGTAVSVGYTPLLGVMLWDRQLYLNLTQLLFFLILLVLGVRNRERFRRGG